MCLCIIWICWEIAKCIQYWKSWTASILKGVYVREKRKVDKRNGFWPNTSKLKKKSHEQNNKKWLRVELNSYQTESTVCNILWGYCGWYVVYGVCEGVCVYVSACAKGMHMRTNKQNKLKIFQRQPKIIANAIFICLNVNVGLIKIKDLERKQCVKIGCLYILVIALHFDEIECFKCGHWPPLLSGDTFITLLLLSEEKIVQSRIYWMDRMTMASFEFDQRLLGVKQ